MIDQLVSTSSSGNIGTGTTVNSYLLHFDPIGTGDKLDGPAIRTTGTYTFDTQVLGIIWGGEVYGADKPPSSLYLDLSDYLGSPGTIYPTGVLGRGLETEDFYIVDETQDFFSISTDLRTINVDFAAYPSYADQFRVITTVPVPAAVWLFFSGLLGLLGATKVKRT